MDYIEKYERLKKRFKVAAIADYLNKNGYLPPTARKYTKQTVGNHIHHKTNHQPFIDGICRMYDEEMTF